MLCLNRKLNVLSKHDNTIGDISANIQILPQNVIELFIGRNKLHLAFAQSLH